MTSTRSVRLLGWICLALALALLALSIPLRCVGRALLVGGFSFLDGALLGTALALATRTRRPPGIYAALLLAALTLWPLVSAWPPGDVRDVTFADAAPGLAAYYFDILRFCLFVLGMPYPFARLGYHAPDPPPPPQEKEPDV